MPRHTHPKPIVRHSRVHVREQRDRYVARRWALTKALYDSPREFDHPEEIRRGARASGWRSLGQGFNPFARPDNWLARNPFNRCACGHCKWRTQALRQIERRQAEREWRDMWIDAAA